MKHVTEEKHNHDHDHDHDDSHSHDHDHDHADGSLCGLSDDCPSCGHDHSHEQGSWVPLALSGVGILAGILLQQFTGYHTAAVAIFLAATIYNGLPLASDGLKGLGKGKIGINMLVTIAAIGATIIQQYEEAALVVFLFNISLRLEGLATDRARNAIEALMELRPEVATLIQGGKETVVPVEQVLPGEVFILKPGDRVPLDGVVIEGATSVNQATITGESLPVEKDVDDDVYAGTINLDGVVQVRTKRPSSETMLASILHMVQEAEGKKSPTETIVNRFARYYTPGIIILAALFAVTPPLLLGKPWIPSVYNSLVLLVIGCPCALTIATPVAMVSAITSASRNGVLVKGSTYIEQVNKADIFTFDKTGTLTEGKLEVTGIDVLKGTEAELLRVAASLEANSKHPIAEAIKRSAAEKMLDPYTVTEFKDQSGRGIEAVIDGQLYRMGNIRLFKENGIPLDDVNPLLEDNGQTSVIVAQGDTFLGVVSLRDRGRPGAKTTLDKLKSRGIRTEMLTGDNPSTAKMVAATVGVDGFHAGLLPDDKVNIVQKLKADGTVVMVGDGVNDSPALAAADVGIAMGGLGSDIALETADIVLLEDDLSKLDYLLRLSGKTMQRIKENIAVAVLVKLGIVLLASRGTISLWMAVVLGDVGLTLLVILNSIRISSIKP